MKPLRFQLILVIVLLLSLYKGTVNAQVSDVQKKSDFWHRISVGGYLGIQVGNVTGIVVSPEAMARIVDQLHGGVGITYQYYWYKNYLYDRSTMQYYNYSQSVYGGRIFLRYYLRSLFDNFLGNIFAHTEYEYLYYTRPYKLDPKGKITDGYFFYTKGKEAIEINSIFVGGGYSQPIAGKAFIDILILFNLNDTYNSPYSNPIFRIGFGVGL